MTRRTGHSYTARVRGLLVIFLVLGCRSPLDTSDREYESAINDGESREASTGASTEAISNELPQPEGDPNDQVPVPADTSSSPSPVADRPTQSPRSLTDEWAEKIRRHDGNTTLVVARVDSLAASRRAVPTSLRWTEAPDVTPIVTRVTATVIADVCAGRETTIDFYYQGGRIDGADQSYSSSMGRDLEVGKSYLLLLRHADGDRFLKGGWFDLAVEERKKKSFRALGTRVTSTKMKEICP